jgi:hypothetical protein
MKPTRRKNTKFSPKVKGLALIRLAYQKKFPSIGDE